MTFLHPHVLWLIVVVLLLWILLVVKSRRHMLSFFSAEIFEKLSRDTKSVNASVRIALFSLAAISMIVALAQPVIEKEKVKINQKAIDLIAALDLSRSMEAKDLYPNRLGWAKRKLLGLIEQSDGIRTGVMVFAENSYVISPITEDKEVASYLVENLDVDSITEKGTNILQLLDSADQQLKDATHKYLLLITDGGDEPEYQKAIDFAKEHHLTLFVLATATEKGAPIEAKEGGFIKEAGKIVLTQLNTKIKELALQTGGVYIHSIASDEDVTTLISEIKKIAVEQDLGLQEVKQYIQLFVYFLVLGAVFLLYAFHSLPRKQTALAFVALMLWHPQESQAGVMDFQTIEQAKSAYEKGDYTQSEKSWSELDQDKESVHYNLGNALYKQKKYKEAIKEYEHIAKDSPLRQKALHNMGNAYAYDKQLDQAEKAYEEALKLGDDPQTKENLEKIKAQQKKQNQDQKDSNKDQKDSKKDQKNNKDQDQQQNKQDQKKQKEDQKNKSSEQKKKDQEAQKQQEKQKSDDEAQKDQESQEEQEQKAAQKEEEKSEAKEAEAAKQTAKDQMSDKEQKHLLDQLKMQKGQTLRYNVPSTFQRNSHEKPW